MAREKKKVKNRALKGDTYAEKAAWQGVVLSWEIRYNSL